MGNIGNILYVLVAITGGAIILIGDIPNISLSGQLFGIARTGAVEGSGCGSTDGAGDGVVTELFGKGCEGEEVLFAALRGMHFGDREGAAGECACLVKDGDPRVSKRLQIIAALYEDALTGGTSDSTEETQGDRDDQGAGTGYHEENEGPMDPGHPHSGEQGGDHSQGQCAEDHGRSIVAGKSGDETLGRCLFRCRIFNQFQNPGDRGLIVGARDPNAERSGEIDTAADHFEPGGDGAGERLAGEGGGIEGRTALQNGAVQRDTLTGFDHDGLSHDYLFGKNFHQSSVTLYIGALGADIHERGDGLSALSHGHGLEQLTHLIKQHDCHAFGILAAAKGT